MNLHCVIGVKGQKEAVEDNILTKTFQQLRCKLQHLAGSILGDDNEAEDALHDAFCRLWTSYKNIDSETDARRLSYTLVYNIAIDRTRRLKTHGGKRVELTGDIGIEEESSSRDGIYEAVVALAEKSLNEKQLAVFRLHDLENIGYAEVAESLGMTQENVRMTLSRARKIIRELYRQQL
ncbi:MAG: RNA polymerase sigma factor [Bacteroides sp.]|nr:RNA polymerase sigma factor [Bacteroides sp.]